ncbi:hypothetical protein DDE82_004338 [Stemphylium lycopersici]|nr:hypothetical protein TW65_06457 [Stemphylium lycopersici]RAR04859.1 hypothetical protein DDE82_004338 [Stemphylium lycopersici]
MHTNRSIWPREEPMNAEDRKVGPIPLPWFIPLCIFAPFLLTLIGFFVYQQTVKRYLNRKKLRAQDGGKQVEIGRTTKPDLCHSTFFALILKYSNRPETFVQITVMPPFYPYTTSAGLYLPQTMNSVIRTYTSTSTAMPTHPPLSLLTQLPTPPPIPFPSFMNRVDSSSTSNPTSAYASPTPTLLITAEAGTSISAPIIIGIIAALLFLFGGLGWFAYYALVTLPRRWKVLVEKKKVAKERAEREARKAEEEDAKRVEDGVFVV